MKKLPRLFIFFSLCFIILFLISALLRFLGLWIDSIRLNSIDSEQVEFLITAARMALPVALFFSILFTLSYTVRRKINALLSIFFIIILSSLFAYGFFLGIEKIQTLNHSFEASSKLSESLRSKSGIILNRRDMTVILLNEGKGVGSNILGIPDYPRVVSFPERPLVYQEAALGPYNSILPLPFTDRIPWLIESVIIDFTLIGREFSARFKDGLIFFGIYWLSLIFLLVSLRFILNLCSWPLANLFLGALVFRLVLSLQVFLNTPEAIIFLNTYLQNRLPESLIPPLIFCALGCLILIYTFFAFLARRSKERR